MGGCLGVPGGGGLRGATLWLVLHTSSCFALAAGLCFALCFALAVLELRGG